MLPPVLITTDPDVPEDIDADLEAFVVYMPGLTKPSSETSLIYLDKVRDYFEGEEHIIVDRGTEFQNARVKEQLADLRVVQHTLPTGAGAFFNPNDNSYFSQVEGWYKRQVKSTHAEAIKLLIEASRRPTEDHIRNYFEHCLLTGPMPSMNHISKNISQGWIYDDRLRLQYQPYELEYRRWLFNSRALSSDVRRQQRPVTLGDNNLDGAHWNTYDPH
jgi:hypothetical protein